MTSGQNQEKTRYQIYKKKIETILTMYTGPIVVCTFFYINCNKLTPHATNICLKKKTASYSWRLLETMNEWVSWHSFVFQIWYTKQRCDPRQTHAAISTDKFTPNLKLTTGGVNG